MNEIPDLIVKPPKADYDFYSLNEKPVFLEHYWLTGTPEL